MREAFPQHAREQGHDDRIGIEDQDEDGHRDALQGGEEGDDGEAVEDPHRSRAPEQGLRSLAEGVAFAVLEHGEEPE